MKNKMELKKLRRCVCFAMVELRLYIDTHPCDERAMAMLHEYKQQLEEIDEQLAHCSTPAMNAECCPWVTQPWPWEE